MQLINRMTSVLTELEKRSKSRYVLRIEDFERLRSPGMNLLIRGKSSLWYDRSVSIGATLSGRGESTVRGTMLSGKASEILCVR